MTISAVGLQVERDRYREMCQILLSQLRERNAAIDRLRVQQHRLREEYRRLRETVLRDDRRTG